MKAAEGMIRGKKKYLKKTGFSEGNVFSNALVMFTQGRPTYNIRLLVMGCG